MHFAVWTAATETQKHSDITLHINYLVPITIHRHYVTDHIHGTYFVWRVRGDCQLVWVGSERCGRLECRDYRNVRSRAQQQLPVTFRLQLETYSNRLALHDAFALGKTYRSHGYQW